MKLYNLITTTLFTFTISAFSQVGIGTTAPKAALDVESSTNGILIPRVALTSTTISTPVVNPNGGTIETSTLVYNTNAVGDVLPGFYYWDGTKWIAMKGLGSTNPGKNTLDQAYDEGGPGAGRVITADSGPVEITNSGANSSGLRIITSGSNSYALYADQNSTGTTIRAANTFTGNNPYSTIQGRNNSSSSTSGAILGISGGAGYAVIGQTDVTSTSRSAVYGNNTRTNGGHGVLGTGVNGVVGETNYSYGYGVWGENYDAIGNGDGVGTYGRGYVGIWGDIRNGGYAGYFNGRVHSTTGFTFPSDIRLKSNIKKIENATDKLVKLSGNYYDINFSVKKNDINGKLHETKHSRKEYGVIAQEVEKIFPEMISEVQFDFTSDNPEKYKSVNYTQLIPVLLESIKELNLRVQELEKRLKN